MKLVYLLAINILLTTVAAAQGVSVMYAHATWSPDGKRVIFTRETGDVQELYSINPDGTDLKPVGVKTFFARQSPDGKKLAYIGGNFPKMSLWVSDADGSNAKDIMAGDHESN